MKAGEDENRQLSRILRAQIHHVLDRGLRSEAFMDEVRTRPSHDREAFKSDNPVSTE